MQYFFVQSLREVSVCFFRNHTHLQEDCYARYLLWARGCGVHGFRHHVGLKQACHFFCAIASLRGTILRAYIAQVNLQALGSSLTHQNTDIYATPLGSWLCQNATYNQLRAYSPKGEPM